jgi:CRP-like cAMP-binding protein
MATTTQDSFNLIRQLSLFTGLTDREMSTLSAVLLPREYEDGEWLCREGDKAGSFFINASGKVQVIKNVPGGGEEVLTEVGPNNILGQVSLIDGKPRSAGLRASGQTVVLECSSEHFDRLFQAGSPFAFKILDMTVVQLSRRLRDANNELRSLYENPSATQSRLREQALHVERAAADQDETERGA